MLVQRTLRNPLWTLAVNVRSPGGRVAGSHGTSSWNCDRNRAFVYTVRRPLRKRCRRCRSTPTSAGTQ
jgi:hypothetical protein